MSPRIKGEKSVEYDFKNAALDLSTSVHLLDPDHAIRLLNFDLSRERGALVGRRGCKAINASHGLPGAVKDIFVCENPDGASDHTKYMLVSYVWDGTDLKLAVANISDTASEDYPFYDLEDTDGNGVVWTTNTRISFCSIYDNTLTPSQQIVLITNGTDQTYYWDFTDTVAGDGVSVHALTAFDVGSDELKLEGFLPVAWKGRAWGWKDNVVYFAAADDPKLWIDGHATAGFFEAPLEQYQNPIRAMHIIGNNLIVINRDTIGHIYPVGSNFEPFRYSQDHEGSGTFNHRTVVPWRDSILFFDKRPPYLFRWNGTTLMSLDPQENMVAGVQQYLNLSDIPNIRMAVGYDNLYISMAILDYARPNANSVRTMAKINLTRRDQLGRPAFPWTLDDIQANDVIATDKGAYTGQIYFADSVSRGTPAKYYVNRMYDFIDRTPYGDAVAELFSITGANIANHDFTVAGDQTATFPSGALFTVAGSTGNDGRYTVSAATLVAGDTVITVDEAVADATADGVIFTDRNITYQWRSGWMDMGTPYVKQFLTFFLRARWEGTPATGVDSLIIGYKIDGWTGFATLKPKEILQFDEIPFPAFAYGRELQIQLTYVTKTSLPIIDQFGFTFRPFPAIRN